MLKDDEERWISNTHELESLAINYYKRLYSQEDGDRGVVSLPHVGFSKLAMKDLAGLNRAFTAPEVENSIWSMGQFKPQGRMGINQFSINNVGMLLGLW